MLSLPYLFDNWAVGLTVVTLPGQPEFERLSLITLETYPAMCTERAFDAHRMRMDLIHFLSWIESSLANSMCDTQLSRGTCSVEHQSNESSSRYWEQANVQNKLDGFT